MKNKSNGPSFVRLFLFSTLLCVSASAIADGAQAPFKPDLAKGAQLAAACSACHTYDGSRGQPTFPILQGQHKEYIYKQLSEYKSGKRVNAIMAGMAATLVTDEDMKNVAAFYESKKTPPGAAKSPETLKLAERLYKGGDQEREIPACAGCHSSNGAGIPIQNPRIGAQHAEYIETQLGYFRDGTRANNAAMSWIAGRLTDKEIKALADYISVLR